jgi:hypothetical protein
MRKVNPQVLNLRGLVTLGGDFEVKRLKAPRQHLFAGFGEAGLGF